VSETLSSEESLEVADLIARIDRQHPDRPMVDLYSLGDEMTLTIEEARGLRDWLNKVLP
jgi:hypothetical protein